MSTPMESAYSAAAAHQSSSAKLSERPSSVRMRMYWASGAVPTIVSGRFMAIVESTSVPWSNSPKNSGDGG